MSLLFPGSERALLAAKNPPTFLPAGPVIVPRSAIANPGDLRITLRLNGQVMQDESTKDTTRSTWVSRTRSAGWAAAGFDNATISAIRGGNAARLLGPLPGYDPSPRCCAVPDRSA